MKKIIYFLILLLLPISVRAYGIDNYRMDVTVLENGDLHVIEMFKLNGSFNGMDRIINFASNYSSYYGSQLSTTGNAAIYNGTSIKLNAIKGVNYSSYANLKEINGDNFRPVSSASKGDYGVYTLSKTIYGNTYRMFNPDSKGKAFYLDYTITDMAITHNDITEVGWNIFTSMNESIGNLEIYIHIPNNKNLLRVWAHGPLWGESKIIDNETLLITISDLDANKAIDVRFAFDKILTTKKNTTINALDKIIEIETKLADKANLEREQAKEKIRQETIRLVTLAESSLRKADYNNALEAVGDNADILGEQLQKDLNNRLDIVLNKIQKKEVNAKIIVGIYLAGLVAVIVYVYVKHDREYKANFTNEYLRDFPSNYPPTTVGYLVRRNINNDDLSASILELVRKKIISYEQLDEKGKDFTFKRNEKINELSNLDGLLVDFLFDNNNEVTLKDLKKRANKNYDSFISNYTSWKNGAKKEALNEQFFESKGTIKFLSVMYALLGIFYAFATKYFTPFHVVMILLCIASIIYFACFTRRTIKGREEYVKWMALKKYMEDFGTLDEKDLPAIELWDKYLIYALTLGCADKLSKVMKIRIEEMQQNGTLQPDLIDIYYMNRMINFNRVLNTSMNSAIQSAYSAKTAASSSSSSGSGFGGGFSGGSFGGGSFGGGGGGGRF